MMQEMMTAIPDDMPLDAFHQYQHWVNWVPALSEEEEQALFARLSYGPDSQTEARLVAGYQKLVQYVARRFRTAAAMVQYEFLDLVQDGNIGLIEAIRSHVNKRLCCSFRTFAGGCIRVAIADALHRHNRVHMHSDKRVEVRRFQRVVDKLTSERGEAPSVETLVRVTGKPACEVLGMLEYLHLDQFVSLQQLFCSSKETCEYDPAAAPLILSESAQRWAAWQDAIEQALGILTEKQQTVLRLRYGLNSPRFLPVEIAALLGVHHATVSTLENSALEKLARVYPDPAALLTPPPVHYYTTSEASALLGLGEDYVVRLGGAWVGPAF